MNEPEDFYLHNADIYGALVRPFPVPPELVQHPIQ